MSAASWVTVSTLCVVVRLRGLKTGKILKRVNQSIQLPHSSLGGPVPELGTVGRYVSAGVAR